MAIPSAVHLLSKKQNDASLLLNKRFLKDVKKEKQKDKKGSDNKKGCISLINAQGQPAGNEHQQATYMTKIRNDNR